MFEFYAKIPWPIQAANPIILIITILLHFNRLYHFNLMEFIGTTFCVICTLYWIVYLYRFIYRNWIGIALGHSADLTKFGKWAVVTGSTQGIGLSYANALAKKGLNIVLLSRCPKKLSEVAHDISEKYKVAVKTITVDFTQGVEIYDGIEKHLENLDVGVLINNVGMCYSYPEYFDNLPNGRKFCQDIIHCNILSVTAMTHVVLEGMLRKKKGVVINVGSISCLINLPFMTLYASSKVFLDSFTSSLELEYREHGIIFQSVIPGYIVGSMSRINKPSIWVPSADQFVEDALKSVGLQKRTAVCLSHQVFHLFMRIACFFRREGTGEITHSLAKQLWLYGKKIMIHRNKGSG